MDEHDISALPVIAKEVFVVKNFWGFMILKITPFWNPVQETPSSCCGACGYELNLSSCNRNTSTIGSKYGKSIKRGIISFFEIDESRFTQIDEFQCIPHFSKHSWSLFRRRTKLLCRKCGNHIGIAFNDNNSAYASIPDGSDSSSTNGVSSHRKFDVRIRSLQPSSANATGTPLFS